MFEIENRNNSLKKGNKSIYVEAERNRQVLSTKILKTFVSYPMTSTVVLCKESGVPIADNFDIVGNESYDDISKKQTQ